MQRMFIVAAAGFALAGCTEPQVVPSAQISATPPTGYREAVREFVRTTYFDPYSLRDVAISQPIPIRHGLTGQETVWYVCVRANAKNRMGAYTGLKDTPIAFAGNQVNRSRTETVDSVMGGQGVCSSAKWEPWPEMEARA